MERAETSYVRVATAIRNDMLSGVFAPGQRMKVMDLARRYDIGPNTVREALHQLSGEGWIEIEPNRGAVVRTITRKVIEDTYTLLEILQRHTARLFVDRASNLDLRELTDVQDAFERSAAVGDHVECSLCNSAFHKLIDTRAGNGEVASTLERYSRLVGPIRRLVGYGDGRAAKVSADHRAIIAAFSKRDPDEAERISAEHLRSSCKDIIQHFERVRFDEDLAR